MQCFLEEVYFSSGPVYFIHVPAKIPARSYLLMFMYMKAISKRANSSNSKTKVKILQGGGDSHVHSAVTSTYFTYGASASCICACARQHFNVGSARANATSPAFQVLVQQHFRAQRHVGAHAPGVNTSVHGGAASRGVVAERTKCAQARVCRQSCRRTYDYSYVS